MSSLPEGRGGKGVFEKKERGGGWVTFEQRHQEVMTQFSIETLKWRIRAWKSSLKMEGHRDEIVKQQRGACEVIMFSCNHSGAKPDHGRFACHLSVSGVRHPV